MEQKRKRWTEEEDKVILGQMKSANSSISGLKSAAEQLGRSYPSVRFRYYNVLVKKDNPVYIIEEHRLEMENRQSSNQTPTEEIEQEETPEYENKGKKWTEEEDAILLNKVKTSSVNLAKCFLVLAEELQRSPKSVAHRWYTVVSKREGVCAFGVISSRHFSKNRKNGEGVPITSSLWRRFLNLIRNLI